MEIIIDEWTEKKYPYDTLELKTLSLKWLGDEGVAITKLFASHTNIHISKNDLLKTTLDYTVEIHVELSEGAKNKALDVNMPLEKFKSECGKFFREAQALRNIIKMKRPFGLKVVCVSYSPPTY